jgi:cytochrome c5
MNSRLYALVLVVSIAALTFAADAHSGAPRHKAVASSPKSNNKDTAEGEKKFQTHCSRCHEAPQQLSPAIAKSVLRHMRVRATLSREDEQQILQYLAP